MVPSHNQIGYKEDAKVEDKFRKSDQLARGPDPDEEEKDDEKPSVNTDNLGEIWYEILPLAKIHCQYLSDEIIPVFRWSNCAPLI